MELRCEHLSKSYGPVRALTDFSYVFTSGIYALLGPNGSGKTTLMNLLVRNLRPDEGEIRLDGTPVRELGTGYFGHVGYMPQSAGLYPYFTARRFMRYMAALKGLMGPETDRQISDLLGEVELAEYADRKIRTLSGGMRQRLMLAQALLGQPDVLILDEPTAGLDPRQRILVRNLISRVSLNRIVLVATHLVADVAPVARQVLFLRKGVLFEQGTPNELTGTLQGRVWTVCARNEEETGTCRVVSLQQGGDGETVRMRILTPERPGPDASSETPTLEDVYLDRFGDEAKAAGPEEE